MDRSVPLLLIYGTALFLTGSCEDSSWSHVSSGPASDPTASSYLDLLDSSEQTDFGPVPPNTFVTPNFLITSQESGFSSEENDGSKYTWDDVDDPNNTSLEVDMPKGYNSIIMQPSSLPDLIPDDVNSSSSLSTTKSKVSQSDFWEVNDETGENQYNFVDPSSTSVASLSSDVKYQTEKSILFMTEDLQEQTTEGYYNTSVNDTMALLDAEVSNQELQADSEELPSSASEADTPTYPERSSEDFSERDILLDTIAMVTVVHRGVDIKTEEGDSDLTAKLSTVSSANSVEVPWGEGDEVMKGMEPHFREERTTAPSISNQAEDFQPDTAHELPQVVCTDWSNLIGKGYIILNMSDNNECEVFRVQMGDRLLAMVETAFSRKMDSPQGSWLISLGKPNKQDKQLLMTLASEEGVVPSKDVLSMLGEIQRGLFEIGIQNYTTATSCQSWPSQPQSDYGKLFVVLVIIGSICVVIIVSGFIYICWQRRLPKLKSSSPGEELHFVENGCHDNPTLDITTDSQSEMQEKKPSMNGVTVEGADNWQILINKPAREDMENYEEDTHL
ncbi:podocalyxin-like protein 2 isoform X1 [Polypterus senegalus]|uniref:podocalyxin-like protein 2 isoform X1 n=1 Tax=Polypterus senegalus TaxID=55291 RepID=UPI0019645D42|nr:podocalyxin-like protein 2 isoform X1 [Polypterus senegalus]